MTKVTKLSGVFRVLVLAMITMLAYGDVNLVFWIVLCVTIGMEAALYVAENKGE